MNINIGDEFPAHDDTWIIIEKLFTINGLNYYKCFSYSGFKSTFDSKRIEYELSFIYE